MGNDTDKPVDLGNEPAMRAFVLANTKVMTPPLVPEVRLRLAEESLPLWQRTEDELGALNVELPFWAFAWAGGQALARFVLDNPEITQGRRVVDLGTGSGLCAIAAKLAGAAYVLAADVDPLAVVSTEINAAENGVTLDVTSRDLLASAPSSADVVLVADLFYEQPLAERVITYLELAVRHGALVLAGDPQRSYFPRDRFTCTAEYQVPVTRELEDAEIKRTSVWQYQQDTY